MVGSSLQAVVYNVSCMQDVAGVTLGCAANDVTLSAASNLTLLDDGCRFPGDTVSFHAVFEVKLGAQARMDIGIWISSDGDVNRDGAKTGTCMAATLPYAPNPPWLDSDGVVGGVQDTCGDMDATHSQLFPDFDITVACYDNNNDGMLDLPYCTSWRQSGANTLCTTPTHATPAAPSKCNCAPDFQVPIYMAPCITTSPLCNADMCYSGGSCLPYGTTPDSNGCVGRVPLVNCDDNNPCTTDACIPSTGACNHTWRTPSTSAFATSTFTHSSHASTPTTSLARSEEASASQAHEGTELSMTWEVEATESLEVGRKVVVDLLLKAATSNRAVCDPSLYSQPSSHGGSVPSSQDTSPPDCSSFLVIRAVPEKGFCDLFNSATCTMTCHLDSLAKGEGVNVDLVILPLQGGVALTMGAVARADDQSSGTEALAVDFDGYAGPQGESVIQTVDARQPIIAPSIVNTQYTLVVINNMPRKILAGYASPLNFTVGLGTTNRCSNAASALVDTVGTAMIQNLAEVAPGVFTFEAVPFAEGILQLRVPAGICTDASGQRNLASDTYLMLYDATPPQVSLTSLSGPTTRRSPILFGITFSEHVFGFGESRVRVKNGRVSSVYAVNETVGQYVVAVWPHKDAWVSLQLLGGAGTDAAGNGSPASEEITVEHYTPLTFRTSEVSGLVATAVVITLAKGSLLTLMWGMVSPSERRASPTGDNAGGYLRGPPLRGGGALFGMGVFIGHLQLLQFLGSLDVPLAGRLRQLTHSLAWLSNGGRSPFGDAEDAMRWEAGDWQSAFVPNGAVENGSNPFCFPPVMAQELEALQAHLDEVDQPFTPRRSELEDLCTSSDFWGVLFYTGCELLLALLAHAVTLAVFRALRRLRAAKGIVYPRVLTPPRFEIVLLMLTYAPLARACVFYITSGIPSGRVVGTIFLVTYPLAFVGASYYFVIFRLLKTRACTYVEARTPRGGPGTESPKRPGRHEAGLARGMACLPCVQGMLRRRRDGQWVDHLSGSKRDVVSQYGPYFEDLRGPPDVQDMDGRRSLSGEELMSPTSAKAGVAYSSTPRWPRAMPGDHSQGRWWPVVEGNLQTCYMLVVITRQLMFAVLSGYRGCQSDRDIGWVQIVVFICVLAFQVLYLVILRPFRSLEAGVAELACVACQLGALLCAALLMRNGPDGSQAARDRISGAMLGLMAACALMALIAMYFKLILAAGRAAMQAVTSASASYASFRRRRNVGTMVPLARTPGKASKASLGSDLSAMPWSPAAQTCDTESASTVLDGGAHRLEYETAGTVDEKYMPPSGRWSLSQGIRLDGREELGWDAEHQARPPASGLLDEEDHQGWSAVGSLAWEISSKEEPVNLTVGGSMAGAAKGSPTELPQSLWRQQQGQSPPRPPAGSSAATAANGGDDDDDDEFSHVFGSSPPPRPRSHAASMNLSPLLDLETPGPLPPRDPVVVGTNRGVIIDSRHHDPVYSPFVVHVDPSSQPAAGSGAALLEPDPFRVLNSVVTPTLALDMPAQPLGAPGGADPAEGEEADEEFRASLQEHLYGSHGANVKISQSAREDRRRSVDGLSLAALQALAASSGPWRSMSVSSRQPQPKAPGAALLPNHPDGTFDPLHRRPGPPRPFVPPPIPPVPPAFPEPPPVPSLMTAKMAGKRMAGRPRLHAHIPGEALQVPSRTLAGWGTQKAGSPTSHLSVTGHLASMTELGNEPISPGGCEPITPSYVSLRTRHRRVPYDGTGISQGCVGDFDASGEGVVSPTEASRRHSSSRSLDLPIPSQGALFGPLVVEVGRTRRTSADEPSPLAERLTALERRTTLMPILPKDGHLLGRPRLGGLSPVRSPPPKESWTEETQLC
eukprot:jgi/Mesvir1/18161/Mv09458-RA.1